MQIAAKYGIGKPGANKPLQEHINWYVRQGYQIISATEGGAQLIRRKQFSIVWFVLGLLAFGIGAVLYILYHALKRDRTVYLSVRVDGSIQTIK